MRHEGRVAPEALGAARIRADRDGPRPIPRGEALDLLASVPLGRIVFTENALPAVRPVNHLVDRGAIVLRTRSGSALDLYVGNHASGTRRAVVVAYEADRIDELTRRGWSVIIVGLARAVEDSADLERYRGLPDPWALEYADRAIRITPDVATCLMTGAAAAADPASKPWLP